jgi:hypothetical protein
MPSRMEKYYQTNEEKDPTSRSKLNEDLYNRIYDEAEYSNMEVIADIETTNEIDITKIKDILKTREDYMREKEVRQIIKKPVEVIIPKETEETFEEKIYDIRDILNKAKDSRETEDYHSLKNTQFDILKGIKLRDIKETKEDDELKGLINTITNTSLLNKMDNKDLSLNLLDDLQSSGHTVITDTDSIKKIMEEQEEKPTEDITIIDKSFFTSSANFANEDFEELKEMSTAIKKNNFLIKLLIFMLLVIITVSMIYIVYTLTK